MKTIHIRGITQHNSLFKELYDKFLKNDPLWHFVIWQNSYVHGGKLEGQHLLVRITKNNILKQAREFLEDRNILYEVYEYPFPKKKKWWMLGLGKRSWEVRYNDIALLLDHLCSEAFMRLSPKEWVQFYNQFLHIAANTKGFSHMQEADFLIYFARQRMLVAKDWLEKLLKENYEKT